MSFFLMPLISSWHQHEKAPPNPLSTMPNSLLSSRPWTQLLTGYLHVKVCRCHTHVMIPVPLSACPCPCSPRLKVSSSTLPPVSSLHPAQGARSHPPSLLHKSQPPLSLPLCRSFVGLASFTSSRLISPSVLPPSSPSTSFPSHSKQPRLSENFRSLPLASTTRETRRLCSWPTVLPSSLQEGSISFVSPLHVELYQRCEGSISSPTMPLCWKHSFSTSPSRDLLQICPSRLCSTHLVPEAHLDAVRSPFRHLPVPSPLPGTVNIALMILDYSAWLSVSLTQTVQVLAEKTTYFFPYSQHVAQCQPHRSHSRSYMLVV